MGKYKLKQIVIKTKLPSFLNIWNHLKIMLEIIFNK